MGDKQPKKKPLVMDAVKPQTASEPEVKEDEAVVDGSTDELSIDEELDAMEAAIGEKPEDTAEETPEPEAEETPTETPEEVPTEPETEPKQTEEPGPAQEEALKEETPEPTVEGLDDDAQPEAQDKDGAPTFAEQLEQTNEPSSEPVTADIPSTKKERVIFKLLRMLIWLFVAIMLPTSLFIIKHSENPNAYMNNTHDAQLSFGQTFFWISLVVGILNFIWGTVRWIMRIVRNHCKVGRIIGKLIGGGIWRFFVFAPIVILTLLFIAPAINNKIRSDAMDQNKEFTDGRTVMSDDFNSGKITADQYVKYSLDYIFNPSNLPNEYKDEAKDVYFDLDEDFIEEHVDELSDDTIGYLAQILTLSNVGFDTDASGNVSKSTSNNPFVQNVSAFDTQSVLTLNKAKLSPTKKALIFYTDTGVDAISEDVVEGIAKVMDNVITKSKDVFGIDYTYKTAYVENSTTLPKLKEVLKANGIDEDILDSNPSVVYVADPLPKDSTSSYKAYHAHTITNKTVFQKIKGYINSLNKDNVGYQYGPRFMSSSPVSEFTVIRPKYAYLENGRLALNTEEVVSHEFGHAIQLSYCLNTIGEDCKHQMIAQEGTAHLFAINAMDTHSTDSLLADDHNLYVRNSCNRLENVIYKDKDLEYGCNSSFSKAGYPTPAFWENYYEIVPNSKSIIAQSWTEEDDVKFLYEQAGATNFRNVMKQLSQRNVTNDYKDSIKNALAAEAYPGGTTLYCGGLCTEKYSMAPTSLKYLYLSTEGHYEIKISVQAPNSTAVSFIRPGSSKQILKEGNGKVDYTLTNETGVIIIAVANASLDPADFLVSITTNDLEDLIEKVDIDFTTNNPFKEMSNGCVELDVNGLVDSLSEISGFVKGINSELDGLVDLGFVTDELDRAEGQAKEASENLKGNKVSICSNKVKDGIDFVTARKKLKEALIEKAGLFPLDLNFLDKNEKDFKLTVFAGINTLDQSGRIYVLTTAGGAVPGDLMLFNVNVTQK